MGDLLKLWQLLLLAFIVEDVRGHAIMGLPAGRTVALPGPYYGYCGDFYTWVPPETWDCSATVAGYETGVNRTCSGDGGNETCICDDAGYTLWSSVWQYENPGNNCSVCGDVFHNDTVPSPAEDGGTYGLNGPTVAFREGQLMWSVVWIPNPHGGFLQWRVNPDSTTEVNNQNGFNPYLLQVHSNGTYSPYSNFMDLIDYNASTPYQVDILTPNRPDADILVYTQLILPDGLVGNQSTVQFNYRTDKGGDEAKQTFRTCADVRIVPKDDPIMKLMNVGMSTSDSPLCLDFVDSDEYTLQMSSCNAARNVIGGVPWMDFPSQYAVINFESTGEESVPEGSAGFCLDVAGAIYAYAGSEIGKYECHFYGLVDDVPNQGSQKWMMVTTEANSSEFQLRNRLTGMCLTAGTPSDWPQHAAFQVSCVTTNNNQIWNLYSD